MKLQILLTLVLFSAAGISTPAQESSKAVSIFDGQTLTGWDFDPDIWRVENGMITGGSRIKKDWMWVARVLVRSGNMGTGYLPLRQDLVQAKPRGFGVVLDIAPVTGRGDQAGSTNQPCPRV